MYPICLPTVESPCKFEVQIAWRNARSHAKHNTEWQDALLASPLARQRVLKNGVQNGPFG
jgi:hypothetical protein